MSKTTDSQITSLDDDKDGTAAAAAAEAAKPAKPAANAKVAAAEGDGAKVAPAKKTKDPERLVSLTIHSSQGDGGNDAVFVSVNEYARLIPRNTPCEVPAYVVNVLREAREERFKAEGKETTSTEVPRYAFTMEEID